MLKPDQRGSCKIETVAAAPHLRYLSGCCSWAGGSPCSPHLVLTFQFSKKGETKLVHRVGWEAKPCPGNKLKTQRIHPRCFQRAAWALCVVFNGPTGAQSSSDSSQSILLTLRIHTALLGSGTSWQHFSVLPWVNTYKNTAPSCLCSMLESHRIELSRQWGFLFPFPRLGEWEWERIKKKWNGYFCLVNSLQSPLLLLAFSDWIILSREL